MIKNISKYKDLIIILSILILIIFFIIFFSTTLSYFKKTNEISGQIQLGELDYTINLNSENDKLYLPGDDVNMDLNIENKVDLKTNLIPFYFRFKIIKGNEDYNLDFITLHSSEDFILDNNFYYYKYKLNFGDKATLINKIHIDENFTNQDIKEIDLAILVDAVQSEYGAYKEVFDDAPVEWIEFIENN